MSSLLIVIIVLFSGITSLVMVLGKLIFTVFGKVKYGATTMDINKRQNKFKSGVNVIGKRLPAGLRELCNFMLFKHVSNLLACGFMRMCQQVSQLVAHRLKFAKNCVERFNEIIIRNKCWDSDDKSS